MKTTCGCFLASSDRYKRTIWWHGGWVKGGWADTVMSQMSSRMQLSEVIAVPQELLRAPSKRAKSKRLHMTARTQALALLNSYTEHVPRQALLSKVSRKESSHLRTHQSQQPSTSLLRVKAVTEKRGFRLQLHDGLTELHLLTDIFLKKYI